MRVRSYHIELPGLLAAKAALLGRDTRKAPGRLNRWGRVTVAEALDKLGE